MVASSLGLLLCTSGLWLPKSKEAIAPGTEEKKETSIAAAAPQKAEQEPAASKPPSAPAAPAASAQPKVAEKTSSPSAAPEAHKDPTASGETLVNRAVPRDAEMIQSRLADLGTLYKAAIDGIWGKGSRAALKAFEQKNSLGISDKWNKETPVALFREAGEAPAESRGSTAV